MKLERSQFLKEIKSVFPEITEAINQEYGLLHLEVGVFYMHTQKLINDGMNNEVAQAFEIADRYNRLGNRKLKNAIDVSFVEGLEFTDTKKNNRNWAWHIFPKSLKDDYISFHGRNKTNNLK